MYEPTEREKKIMNLRQEICNTECDLTRGAEIGDYKIIKTYEARLRGEADPYDTDQLMIDRKAARQKIRDMRKELEELETNE